MPDEPPRTPPLKRHPALLALSRDHHFVLIQALSLRRAADGAPEPHHGAVPSAEAFLAYYHDDLIGHMADEEESLLAASSAVSPGDAGKIRSEHDEIRERTAVLKQALADGEDPRPAMKRLGDILHDHVRFEERVVFEAVQQRLSADDLEALRLSIETHREARGRGPGCCVPPPQILYRR
jgi:hemerythrin-like domain-containing protein